MRGVTLSVSQLNDYVRRSLAGDPILQVLTVRGEVTNYKPSASGHLYFSLKDENCCIDCVLFRQYAGNLKFRPQNGLKVLVDGTAGLYMQTGRFQLYATNMEKEGAGELYQRFLELKEKLTAQGLFDVSRKRPLPMLPVKVGIVTSESGAVLHDIRTVAGRRFPGLPLVLRPAQVQGEGAAEDIAAGLDEIAHYPGVDVVIVGRGGGSMEDLWCFNEECVARAVAACPVPVISAVGHETDFTLCDFAADMRAATPSAAAELAVPVRTELQDSVSGLQHSLRQAALNTVQRYTVQVSALQERLRRQDPLILLRGMLGKLEQLRMRMDNAAAQKTMQYEAKVEQLQARLSSAGPKQTLERGYAIAMKNRIPVSTIKDMTGTVNIVMRDGTAVVNVLSTEEGDAFGS